MSVDQLQGITDIIFDEFDSNGDGAITPDEAAHMAEVHIGVLKIDDLKLIMDRAEENFDGQLTKEEFLAVLQRLQSGEFHPYELPDGE